MFNRCTPSSLGSLEHLCRRRLSPARRCRISFWRTRETPAVPHAVQIHPSDSVLISFTSVPFIFASGRAVPSWSILSPRPRQEAQGGGKRNEGPLCTCISAMRRSITPRSRAIRSILWIRNCLFLFWLHRTFLRRRLLCPPSFHSSFLCLFLSLGAFVVIASSSRSSPILFREWEIFRCIRREDFFSFIFVPSFFNGQKSSSDGSVRDIPGVWCLSTIDRRSFSLFLYRGHEEIRRWANVTRHSDSYSQRSRECNAELCARSFLDICVFRYSRGARSFRTDAVYVHGFHREKYLQVHLYFLMYLLTTDEYWLSAATVSSYEENYRSSVF